MFADAKLKALQNADETHNDHQKTFEVNGSGQDVLFFILSSLGMSKRYITIIEFADNYGASLAQLPHQ